MDDFVAPLSAVTGFAPSGINARTKIASAVSFRDELILALDREFSRLPQHEPAKDRYEKTIAIAKIHPHPRWF